MDAIPDALKEAGRRAAELSQNPYARGLLAAGLVAAAAALASNKNVRETTRRNLRGATEAAEVAADNAGKIGLAIVNAATEAVQKMLNLGAELADAGQESGQQAAPTPSKSPSSRSKASTKSGSGAAKTGAAKSTAKPAQAKSASASGAKTKAKPAAGSKSGSAGSAKKSSGTGAGATRKRTAKKDS